MDQSLLDIFNQGQYSLINPGMDAFKLDQQTKQQQLQDLYSKSLREAQMHPLEMQTKEANIRQSDAAAGYSNTLSAQLKDKLNVLQGVPMDQRVAEEVARGKAALSGDRLKMADTEMEEVLGAASMAARNNGVLPLNYTFSNPKYAEMFKTPEGVSRAAQIAKAYFMTKPKEMYAVSNDERDTARALQVANIAADATKESAATRVGGTVKFPKTPKEAYTRYSMMAEQEQDPQRKQELTLLAQEAWTKVEQELVLKAQAGLGGKLDLPTTASTGKPTNYPMPVPGRNSGPRPGSTPDNPIKLD